MRAVPQLLAMAMRRQVARCPQRDVGTVLRGVERDGVVDPLDYAVLEPGGRIDPRGRITRLAGDPDDTAGLSGDGGPALSAQMNKLVALAGDGHGNLYVSDSGNKRVRKITPGGVITTVA